jgi:hypothetical protein
MMYIIMPEIRRRNGVMQGAGVRNIKEYHTFVGHKSWYAIYNTND